MSEEALSIRVETYAGYRADEAPPAFWLGDHRVEVVDVLDRWLAPDHRYFKVRATDGDIYVLRHDTMTDNWDLSVFRRGSSDARSGAQGG